MASTRRPEQGLQPTAFEQTTVNLQAYLLLAALVLTPLVFSRATLDIFGVVKAAFVVVVAVGVATLMAVRVLGTGRALLPRHPVLIAVGAFLAFAALATVTSYAPALSLTGHYSRYSGLVVYLAVALLFFATLRTFDLRTVRWVAAAALVGAAGVALYGFLQWAGLDPIDWRGFSRATSTVGNPNYVSAHVAIGIPLALWVILDRRYGPVIRAVAAGVAVALVVSLVDARSNQGYVAGGAGAAVFLLAWLRTQRGALRRYGQWAWGGAVAVGAVTFFAGLLGQGPASFITEGRSFRMRGQDMLAAINMVRDFPFLGVGFDRYGGFYNSHRAAEALAYQDLRHTTSSPHSVHLNMFASGGVLLGLAYLVFVGFVAWLLIRGLRDLEGPRLIAVGALGGAWVAYQTQSFISIDVPSLVVTGWVLAAAVVIASDPPELRSWRPQWVGASSGAVRLAAGVGVVLVALLTLWPTWLVVRADVHAKEAERLERADDPLGALIATEAAFETNPWEPRYAHLFGRRLAGLGQAEEALAAFEAGAERDPRSLGPVLSAARFAVSLDDEERAEHWYRRAVELEPNDPDVIAEAERILGSAEAYADPSH